MPILSAFYGIVIRMYFFDNQQHKLPHIHAEYQSTRAVFAIETGETLAGHMPARQQKLVQAWIEIHRDELFADWNLASNGEEIFKIDPLR